MDLGLIGLGRMGGAMAQRIVCPLMEQVQWRAAAERVFPINARQAYRVVNGLAQAAGLAGLHPHSLRHYFAT